MCAHIHHNQLTAHIHQSTNSDPREKAFCNKSDYPFPDIYDFYALNNSAYLFLCDEKNCFPLKGTFNDYMPNDLLDMIRKEIIWSKSDCLKRLLIEIDVCTKTAFSYIILLLFTYLALQHLIYLRMLYYLGLLNHKCTLL